MFTVRRDSTNPLIVPDNEQTWRSLATFNASPVKYNNKLYCLYRAISKEDWFFQPGLNLSEIGICYEESLGNFVNHEKFISPEEEWEKYGCEDPRTTFLDGKYYTFYTAISNYPITAEGIKVALAESDDLKTISKKSLITPFNAKAMALFPEKINGKYTVILTANTDLPPAKIGIAQFEDWNEIYSQDFWNKWYFDLEKNSINLNRDHTDHVEVGAVPIKTKYGWLLIYSHIQKYFTSDKIFGIEAVLLDLNDPTKLIGRTDFPILTPEASYEHYGMIPNIIFPSGAIVEDEDLIIYYGASDTTVCRASVNLENLLKSIRPETKLKTFTRAEHNPILSLKKDSKWEDRSVFNPAALFLDNKIHILYRAQNLENTSSIGYANTSNGIDLDFRLDHPIYIPRADEESKQTGPGGFSGCEDPRVTLIDDQIYLLYTAYNGLRTFVAISSISVDDFLNQNWKWEEPTMLTPDNIDDKNSCLLPEKIDGKFLIFHRINGVVCIDFLNYWNEAIDHSYELFGYRRGMWDSAKVGISAPPIKTKAGWLLLYHGVSDKSVYRMGAALLDLEDPTILLGRSNYPLFEPQTDYELIGDVNNVIFPCGAVLKDDTIFLYYGGADKVVGVATAKLDDILESFK